MHKFFKPYLHLIITLGVLLSSFILYRYEFEISYLPLMIILLGSILEIIRIKFGENKGLSFEGALFVFSALYLNYKTVLLIVICSHIIDEVAKSIKSRELSFNNKFFFNMSSQILSVIGGMAAANLFGLENIFLRTFITLGVYNIINISLVTMIIYLFTGDKEEVHFNFEYSYFYYFFLIDIIFSYAYDAYSYPGMVIFFMFLAPFQSFILGNSVAKELKANLSIDPLTKAFNRGHLNNTLLNLMNNRTKFTIFFLDFDNFKNINDTYGHEVGDAVLQHFVATLTANLRKTDKVYRYGGDEFCLVIKNLAKKEKVIDKLENIEDQLQLVINGTTIKYSFSLGYYDYSGNKFEHMSDIFHCASKSMANVKHKKKEKLNIKHTKLSS